MIKETWFLDFKFEFSLRGYSPSEPNMGSITVNHFQFDLIKFVWGWFNFNL